MAVLHGVGCGGWMGAHAHRRRNLADLASYRRPSRPSSARPVPCVPISLPTSRLSPRCRCVPV